MGIVAAIWVEQQPARHPGILARELAAHLAQPGEFSLVVFQEFLAHALLYLVLTADQLQRCIELDFFVHVFVNDLAFDVEPQAAAENVSAREEDMGLTDAGLKDANAFFERDRERILFLACGAIEAVNVGQSKV